MLVVGMFAGFFLNLYLAKFMPVEEVDWDQYTNEALQEEEGYRVASSLLSFRPNVFFMALLPPILFNSGYQLRRELFYRHIRPIVMFACLGTFLSSLCTGLSLYGIKELGWMGDFSPTLLELLTFGSLIAATDTVSVLAVFSDKKVDPHLFYLVFGESSLNDAVALVLFKAFSDLLLDSASGAVDSIARRSAFFFAEFLAEAIGSPILGICCGIFTALVFKHIDFREHAHLELPLYIVLLMYVPFIAAECMHLSGIVTIFFSGMSARRYVSPNVSEETAKNAEVIFKCAAYVAETCIFLELGLSVFGLSNSFRWTFIAWAFVAALLGRAVGIYPLAVLWNLSLTEMCFSAATVTDESISSDEDDSYYLSESERSCRDDYSVPSIASTISSHDVSQSSRKKVVVQLKTPPKRQDKTIQTSFMHVLWFAGLRGAVAYACARDFPEVFGHNDEFIAATVVIVFATIIFMGGATEHLLRILEIELDVNVDEYMEEWKKQRQLRGPFHRFGKFLCCCCC